MNDQELLNAYAADRSQEAFAALIERYVRLVYSACWRQLGDHQLAEDATQAVFLLLSQKSGDLLQTRLASWLLTTARNACRGIQRTQRRRQRREKAVAMSKPDPAPMDAPELLAMLDTGLLKLREADREAVVLRYLRAQPLREVGQALGVSEEAARKRVDRGLEKLRRYFRARGVESDSVALAAVLMRHSSVPGMPETIKQSILETCHAGGPSAAVGTCLAAINGRTMPAAVLQVMAVAITLAAGLGFAGWLAFSGDKSPAMDQAAAAPSLILDLSTPMDAWDSLCRALKSVDRQSAYACLTADPNRKATPIDALLTWNLAENRLRRAEVKAFGQAVPDLETGNTIDDFGRMLEVTWRLTPQSAKIDDDRAVLAFPPLNAAVLNLLPPFTQKVIQLWLGRPIRFVRSNRQWKVDLDHSVRVVLAQDGKPISGDIAMQYGVGLGEIVNQTAQLIENGQLARVTLATTSLWDKVRQLRSQYDLRDLSAFSLPADLPDEKAMAMLYREP